MAHSGDTLFIDLETFSTIDLRKSGVYRYAEGAEIMMASYAFGNGPVQIWDITQGKVPDELLAALRSPEVIKVAHNAPFERTLIKACWGIECPPEQWRCTAVMAATQGLPRSLADVGRVLGLADQKMVSGSALIRYFCVPCKPTKKNGGRTRNLPGHDLERWQLFRDYCIRDTQVEQEIYRKLSGLFYDPNEQRMWELDQRINDRGLAVDLKLVDQAIKMDTAIRERLLEEAMQITQLSNPNSIKQLQDWLSSEHDVETETLDKATVKGLLGDDLTPEARRVLEIRQQLGKTSVAKYAALDRYTCSDGRIRGIFLFYGAGRTGRWSGSGFQPQNLARPSIEDETDIDVLRSLVKRGDMDSVELLYGNVPQALSDLIRTAIIVGE